MSENTELVIKHFSELSAFELHEILRIRSQVFVVEQNCPYPELDGRDNGRQALEACLPAVPSADFYRVKLTLRDKKEAETLRARFAHIPHLQLLAEEAEGDLWQDAGEDTLLGVYFSLLKQAAGEDPRAALTAEISRKLLAGREVTLP